jgi:hypothetical protein
LLLLLLLVCADANGLQGLSSLVLQAAAVPQAFYLQLLLLLLLVCAAANGLQGLTSLVLQAAAVQMQHVRCLLAAKCLTVPRLMRMLPNCNTCPRPCPQASQENWQ